MTNLEATKLSTTSNFMLVGERNKEHLALNGVIVSVNELDVAGFKFGKKYTDRCLICSPTEKNRKWYEVPVSCNGENGPIWVCSNCSRVFIHETRGQVIWSKLLKTLKPAISCSNDIIDIPTLSTPYLPTKDDFELAYRATTRLGESSSLDAILDQIEIFATEASHSLKNNWRMVTEENVKIWLKK